MRVSLGKRFCLLFAILIFSAARPADSAPDRNERPSLDRIRARLDSQKINSYVFSNDKGNRFLIVPKFGGRILAVSVAGVNLFWTSPDVLSGMGGQRTWIGPPDGPKGFIRKRDGKGFRDFSALDPGRYESKTFIENRILGLSNNFRAVSNDNRTTYDVSLTRWFQHLDDPLATDPALGGAKYGFLGIKFGNNLNNNTDSNIRDSIDFWNILQVPAGGTAIVPVTKIYKSAWRGAGPGFFPDRYVKTNADSFSFFIQAGMPYEIGVPAEFLGTTGTLGYLMKSRGGDSSLIVIKFPVRSREVYVDRATKEPDTNGDAIQVSSSAEPGRETFGELGCHSWAIDIQGKGVALFPVYYHIYKAPLDILMTVGKKLVCPDFDKVHLF
jgi:hypothetical protein